MLKLLSQRNKKFGEKGEDLAVEYLIKSGHKILARNFHSRFGEIDIVSVFDQTIYFNEVKSRSSSKFGFPQDAVTRSKLEKITKTAHLFTQNTLLEKLPMKIQVVAINQVNGRTELSIVDLQ